MLQYEKNRVKEIFTMGRAISRGFKRGLAVILATLMFCSLSVTTFAKREDNPLQNYDKMTIKGTDSMTLVFHKILGRRGRSSR